MRLEAIIGGFVILAVTLFIFLTMYLGIFRFDKREYKKYIVTFNDATGLNKKDEVKISGVKVGNIDSIELDPTSLKAHVHLSISKQFVIYENAIIAIRQDGLLGVRFIDIKPGGPPARVIEEDTRIVITGLDGASVDTIMHKIDKILADAEHVAHIYMKLLGSDENVKTIERTMHELTNVVTNLGELSRLVARITDSNGKTIETLLADVSMLIGELKEANVTANLNQAIESFKKTNREIQKLTDGVGAGENVLNTLVGSENCTTIRKTVTCVNDAVSWFERVHVGLDSHAEFMLSKTEHTDERDIKGYFNAFMVPCDNYFVLGGLVTRSTGRVKHRDIYTSTHWHCNKDVKSLFTHEDVRKFDSFLWNFQIGRAFGNIALRGGLFESTLGAAVDVNLPLFGDSNTWISSLEIFDFHGKQRIDDNRPHLKWLNRLFLGNRYFYIVGGADDLVSRHNISGFLGAGLAFVY